MKNAIKTGRVTAFLLAMLLIVAGAGALLTGCGRGHDPGTQAADDQLYTCGMHPQVIQNKPGNCPICGMKLTPVRKQGAALSATASGERKIKFYKSSMNPGETSPLPGKDSMGMDRVPVYETEDAASDSQLISVDPVMTQNMNIHTAIVIRGPLRRTIRTVGVIDYNEAGLADVTTKFKGWVEELFVDTTGQQVHRGEPLFEIYAPELYSAQREYVLALESTNAPGGAALKASARTKLKFFDITDEQIAELERIREPRKTLQVVSPQDGFVVEKMVVKGQMVDAGMKLYRLADLGLVWVQAQIYEQDLPYVNLGQETTVTLSYLPGREFRGRLTYVYPNVDEKTRTARVRMEFHNPGYFLKPGMFATVQVLAELEPSVLLVPDMAILRSGEKCTVFVVLDGGKFESRTVTLGPQGEHDTYQVLSGLSEGDRIVTSGQFLLDSESQLREAIQKMSSPKSAATAPSHETHAPMPVAVARPATQANTVKYTCPMSSHADVVSDKAGKCPKCEMNLVPTDTVAHGKIAEANWRKQHPIAEQPAHEHQD
ncbi:MAG TPA: efflux RND transporter periplasmic adaptor subunit [Candidatus Paceibacterota bacterium]|nr:efflux RND transporter periplasmic adaptor subunit [Verrucomicrobiota bacterium]HRZ45573.1 efflux RND transporter periplasmic adaptor subunit [Candidatus Paceibacterota bacterium]